jgi:hypothetical protein
MAGLPLGIPNYHGSRGASRDGAANRHLPSMTLPPSVRLRLPVRPPIAAHRGSGGDEDDVEPLEASEEQLTASSSALIAPERR